MHNSPAKNRIHANAGLRESGDKPELGPMMAELYRNAEAQLRKRKKKLKTENLKLPADSHRLLHELQVHQVELEMQNAELQEARERMEVLLEKYTDLYDFAPVGYFSLDEQGKILEANLSGATLLGVERSLLINQRLPSHVTPASRPVFLAFLKRVFAGAGRTATHFGLTSTAVPPSPSSVQENGAGWWSLTSPFSNGQRKRNAARTPPKPQTRSCDRRLPDGK